MPDYAQGPLLALSACEPRGNQAVISEGYCLWWCSHLTLSLELEEKAWPSYLPYIWMEWQTARGMEVIEMVGGLGVDSSQPPPRELDKGTMKGVEK